MRERRDALGHKINIGDTLICVIPFDEPFYDFKLNIGDILLVTDTRHSVCTSKNGVPHGSWGVERRFMKILNEDYVL